MATIRLIVTGDLEELALHESLRRMFGTSRHDGEEVIWDPPRKLHSATSRRLSPSDQTPGPMRELAKAAFSEVVHGKLKHGVPADLVIVIDDVELGNIGQEAVVAKHFRDALRTQLEIHSLPTRERYESLLRERCSFHLLRPMIESYFFGDKRTLQSMGVLGIPILRHTDVERFETNDPHPDWLAECQGYNQRHQHTKPWWHHETHPKHYLEHLLERQQTIYDEKIHGESALQKLEWKQIPKTVSDCTFVRCLFEDLADWFGSPNPLGLGTTQPCLYPLGTVDRSNLLLRNL